MARSPAAVRRAPFVIYAAAAAGGQLDTANYYFKDTGGTERLVTRINARHDTTDAAQPGGSFHIWTTPAGGALTEAVIIDQSQNMGLGIAPTYKLDINGNLRVATGFGCNGTIPQTAVAVNAAATDAAETMALVNQLRAALIANGICS